MTTFKIIKKIIEEDNDVFVKKKSNIRKDLNLDSLDLVEKLLTIEDHFKKGSFVIPNNTLY